MSTYHKRADRAEAEFSTLVSRSGEELPATVRNVTLDGCYLQCAPVIDLAERVSFRVNDQLITGKIVRKDRKGLGISFDFAISPDQQSVIESGKGISFGVEPD